MIRILDLSEFSDVILFKIVKRLLPYMSLAQAFSQKMVKDQNKVREEAQAIAIKIRQHVSPIAIILFGSAACGQFNESSDFDILLIFEDLVQLRQARHRLHQAGPLSPTAPLDLIFITKKTYDQKKEVGGICFVANHEGVYL